MGAIADLSDVVNRATGGNSGTPENVFFHKQARLAGAAATATIAGRPASLWRYDGQPGAGVAPGAVALCDNTTAGGLQQTDPSGGRQKWLLQFMANGLVGGQLILYDRLLHVGGLSGTSVAAQNVQTTTPSPALTRYTDGLGNFVFAEIHTQIGATGTTLKMSYVDEGGNTQDSPLVVWGGTGFREESRAVLLPLASGDRGVAAVKTVTATATTGTAGAFGVVIGHPLAYANIGTAGVPGWRDFVTGLPGVPEIKTDACLAFLWVPQSTTAPELWGSASMIEA